MLSTPDLTLPKVDVIYVRIMDDELGATISISDDKTLTFVVRLDSLIDIINLYLDNENK